MRSGRGAQGAGHGDGRSRSIVWRWDTLWSTRSRTTERDLLAQLLGNAAADSLATERPRLRIDLVLHGRVNLDGSVPMPSAATWVAWSREATGRLETIERLVSEEIARETSDGKLEVLAWQGEPEITLTCTPLGELRLRAVKMRAFQIIDVPRGWDDPEGNDADDEERHEQLSAMFRRVKAALVAWVDVMDHFR